MKATRLHTPRNQRSQPPAIILNQYLTTGLAVIRDLTRHHIPTYLLQSTNQKITFSSTYAHGITCPNPATHPTQYIDFLIQLGQKLPTKGVLLPTSDIDLHVILTHKKHLQPYYHYTTADHHTTDHLLNKQKFYQLLTKHHIPHPRTWFLTDTTNLKKLTPSVTYPCILKPAYSGYFRSDFHTKVFYIPNQHHLKKWYTKTQQKHHTMMIQEIIPGDAPHNYGLNTYYTKTNHTPHGIIHYQRIRAWPPLFGNGCFIRTIPTRHLQKIITPLIQDIGYHGIIDAEIKQDPRDNTFKLIEINPRIWMQYSLAATCNYPFAYYAYCDALGKNLPSPPTHHTQCKWVYLFEDIPAARTALTHKHLTIPQWIRSYCGKKQYALFSWDDPLPSILLAKKTMYQILHKKTKKSSYKNPPH